MTDAAKRPAGYYWVKVRGRWMIGFYDGADVLPWEVFERTTPQEEADVEQVGPAIGPPDKDEPPPKVPDR